MPDIHCREKYKKIDCISYKGHIFDSIEKLSIVTNAYVPDWTSEKFNVKDSYQKNIYNILCEFSNSNKQTIESLI